MQIKKERNNKDLKQVGFVVRVDTKTKLRSILRKNRH